MKNRCCRPVAMAMLRGSADAPDIRGCVRFYPRREGTLAVAEVWGLPHSPTGFFALHIHDGESCLGEGFPDAGGHYNPGGMPHPLHAGDLPPLLVCRGKACMAVLTGRFHPWEVIGKTVVIHENPDDFRTQPAGDPGKKIACGMIRRCRK